MWKRRIEVACIALALVLVAGCSGQQQTQRTSNTLEAQVESGTPYAPKLDPNNFVKEVTNPYYPLKPGMHWVYSTTTTDGLERNDVVVTNETKMILGISAIVVHDTVRTGGQLTEDTYDWYAQDKQGAVWYLGEDTKELENGTVTSTEGSWEAGVSGAQPGVLMQANPTPGGPWYWQEYFQGEAEDQARVLSKAGTYKTPAGTFGELLVTEERSPVEPGIVERKYYRRGFGEVAEQITQGPKEISVLVSPRP